MKILGIFDTLANNFRTVLITDIIDILLVGYLIYLLTKLIKDTTAEKLVKGVVWLVVIMQVAYVFQLNTIYFSLQTMMEMGLIAVIVLFQPELRKMLEQVGKSSFSSLLDREAQMTGTQVSIVQIVEACGAMSWSRTGALIVFERGDKLTAIASTGTPIESKVSSELVKNIFYPKAPLHDGAMIIRDGKILSAACVLPLSANQSLSRDLGTRHRAAVGMSENADAICVIVSEETGSISVAIGGMLKRHLAPEMLEKLLINELMPKTEEPTKKSGFFSKRKEKHK